MGRRTFPTHASEATLTAAAPFWGPFGAADPYFPFVRDTLWRWAALVRAAIPARLPAPIALGWEFGLAVVAAANEYDADQGAIDAADGAINAAGAPEGPAPPNAAEAAIFAVEDGPAAETPLMGSLHGILGDETA